MIKVIPRGWAISIATACLAFCLVSAGQTVTAYGPEAAKVAQSDADGNDWTIRRYLSVIADLNGARFVPESFVLEDPVPEDSDAQPRVLLAGTVLWATGRTADESYLYVTTSRGNDGESGWVATEDVVAFGIGLIPTNEMPDGIADAITNVSLASGAGSSGVMNSASASNISEGVADAAATIGTSIPGTVSVGGKAYVTSAGLNVRAGPGIDSDVLTQVTRGAELVVLDRSGGWLLVSLPDGSTAGWVSSRFVRSDAPALALPTFSSPTTASTAASSSAAASAAGLSGTLVFQQRIGGQIYTYNLSSGALQPLTVGADPALSPDGLTVAFTRVDGLYLIDANGANERRIFSGREGLASPKWSPDGKTLIFTRGDEWQACVKWGPREACTESNEVGEGKYKKIMYAIAAVEADGSDYRDVVSTKPARAPDWTEAGIVYQSIDGLQLTSADRNAVNSLIDYDYLDPFYFDPDRQPSGGQIVFQSKEGSHWQIFTINSDGSGRHALTKPRTALVDQLPSSVAPAFSPDGQQIVYLSNITGSGEAGDWKLWVMNADGSNQRPLPIELAIEYTYGVEQVVSWR